MKRNCATKAFAVLKGIKTSVLNPVLNYFHSMKKARKIGLFHYPQGESNPFNKYRI